MIRKIGKICLVVCVFVFADQTPSNAGKMWIAGGGSTGDPIVGGSGCAVAQAQAELVYGGTLVSQGCFEGPSSAIAYNNADTANGPPRPGVASAYCTDGAILVDDECWEPDDLQREPKKRNYCPVGNPIDPVSGVKIEQYTDVKIGQNGELALERYYSSNISKNYASQKRSRFGYGWRSNFDASAYFAPFTNKTKVYIVNWNGENLVFSKNSDGTWLRNMFVGANWQSDPSGQTEKLISSGDNIELTDDLSITRIFDGSGKLIQIKYPTGYLQNLNYDGSGFNNSVIDSYGRSINFTYTKMGQALSVTTSTGISINYSYIEKLDKSFSDRYFLSGPRDPNIFGTFEPVLESVSNSGVSSSKLTYHYENPAYPLGMTGITDERGIRYATFAYGDKSYAIETKHIGDTDNFSMVFDLQNGKATVTSPLGKQSMYNFSLSSQGRRQLDSITGAASANCPASVRSTIFDNNGFIISEIDEEGRKTTYVRDAQGRPTSITRGAP